MHQIASSPHRAHQPSTTRRALLAAPLLAAVMTLGGCSLSGEKESPTKRTVLDLVAWPEKDIWPEALLSMPQPTIDNYKAVVPRKDLLQYMPCYCGCYANGHLSVYDCYVAEERDDGSIVLDTMSFG